MDRDPFPPKVPSHSLESSTILSSFFKMKIIAIAFATLAAASTAEAAHMQKWCWLPGQGCYKLKRAADVSGDVRRSAEALAEAMPDTSPEGLPQWCWLPGQGCQKVKRAAEAVDHVKRSADALAEAMAAIEEFNMEE
ncbi:hypothetical protein FE257_011904 [Aspergillus nanangensis]|uniref:Mating alpha-pheromone PpgA n=1 Tax=Aspergillus nanangensis TaxID=2582783 RepID=A0AAD4GR54_ASPNN|nr:hypothetical protein FE257_011904 [Aspergillus nanangensis]